MRPDEPPGTPDLQPRSARLRSHRTTWRKQILRRAAQVRLRSTRLKLSALFPTLLHPCHAGPGAYFGRLLGGVRVRRRAGRAVIRFPTGHVLEALDSPLTINEAIWSYYVVAYLDQYDASAALAPGAVVVDVGAHVGVFTLLASELVGDAGQIVAIEPSVDNADCLRRLVAANGLPGVCIAECAAGAEAGQIALARAREGSHLTSLEDGVRELVPQETLDGLVAQFGLERVSYIKIDTEGMEREVLQGAAETLRRFRPRIAVSGYHRPGDAADLPALLDSIAPGYRFRAGSVAPMCDFVIWADPQP